MKHPISGVVASAIALAVSGCGQTTNSGNDSHASTPDAAQIYSGAGKVTAVAGNQVTIAHGPIEGIGWPAMTMTFSSPADVVTAVKPGDEVAFSFRQQGSAYQLTSLQKR